jgi:hypothetical protein
MNKLFIFIALMAFCVISCKPAAQPAETGKTYGAEITADNAIDIDKLLTQLTTQDSVRTKLEGNVESVCQVKGCWMNLVPDDGNEAKSIFVKFKDYGFFMPLDLAGEKVVMQGVAYKEVTSVDELKHYAEDEGLSQEEIDKITEPKEELKFMADGVIVL